VSHKTESEIRVVAMTERDAVRRNAALAEYAKRQMKKYPWLFFREYVYTLDPHDSKQPVKRFPDKPYCQDIVEEIHANKMVLIEKSRQMMVTWIIVAYALYRALTLDGQYIFLVSRKEDDAGLSTPLSLLSRVKFIHDHLPKWLQQPVGMTKQPPILVFEGTASTIHAVSQDSDAFRSYTASMIFMDEMAFQERARDAYTAAKPTIDGGGRFIGVSTPNGRNFFYALTSDAEGARA